MESVQKLNSLTLHIRAYYVDSAINVHFVIGLNIKGKN